LFPDAENVVRDSRGCRWDFSIPLSVNDDTVTYIYANHDTDPDKAARDIVQQNGWGRNHIAPIAHAIRAWQKPEQTSRQRFRMAKAIFLDESATD
jgi:hypothetical protein